MNASDMEVLRNSIRAAEEGTMTLDREDVKALLEALERLDLLELKVDGLRPAEYPLPLQRAWDRLLQMRDQPSDSDCPDSVDTGRDGRV